MAFQLATAFVKIGVRGIGSLGVKFGAVHGIVTGLTTAFAQLAIQISLTAARLSGEFVRDVVKAGSDAVELENLFVGVFKEGAAEAKKFAETMAVDLSRGVLDLMQQMANFQDTFVPLGFAREEATRLSKEMLTLVQDVASFRNTKPAEVANLFTSALVGNHRAVRRFGIVITEASLKQELLNRGIANGLKNATRQEKAMARLSIMQRDSRDAMGDAALTAGTFENRMRGLVGTFQDVSAEIGKGFLPALAEIANKLTETLRDVKPQIMEMAKEWRKWGLVMVEDWDKVWRLIQLRAELGVEQLKDTFASIPNLIARRVGTSARLEVDMITSRLKRMNSFFATIGRHQQQIVRNVIAGLNKTDPVNVLLPRDKMGIMSRLFGLRLKTIAKDAMGGFSGEGSVLDAINISPETQKKLDAFNKALAELKGLKDDIPDEKDRPFNPDEPLHVGDLTATSIKLPTGFIDFDKANQKIQEALLKGDDVQDNQLTELKEGNRIAGRIENGIKEVQNKLNNGGAAANIPVANN